MGIAVLSVLLLLTVICSVGLVIWIVQLNKKLAQAKLRNYVFNAFIHHKCL